MSTTTKANMVDQTYRKRLGNQEQRIVQVAENYSPADSTDWTLGVGATSAPTTQDEALDALAAAAVTGVERTLKVQYDFSVHGGAVGNISLSGSLPDNAIVVGVVTDILTTPNSTGGTGTIRLNVATDGNLAPALAADNAQTGVLFSDPDSASADVPVKMTAARTVRVTVATAAVTAGKVNYFIKYLLSD